jgi:hypothetical protein
MKAILNHSKAFFCFIFIFTFFQLNAQTWRPKISSGGSDYSIKASFDSDGPCQCNDKYIFGVFRNSYLYYMGGVSGAKSSGSHTFAVGPSNSATYYLTIKIEGRNQFVFNCAASCESSGTYNKKVTTSAIKQPKRGSTEYKDGGILITWGKGTNIPDKHIKYIIARDDPENIIATVKGTARSYKDENVGPNARHAYYIFTHTDDWGGHTSRYVGMYGSTPGRAARASIGQPKKVVISWDDVSDQTDEVTIRRNGEQIVTLNINSEADTSYTDSDPSLIPGYLYDYAVTWVKNDIEYGLSTQGATQPNGRISGKVATPLSQLPIANVEVCAVLEDSIDQSLAGTTYCDSTDENGQFDIRRIYYHTEASFTVTPSKENHAFDPASFKGQLLELEFPNINLNFDDTTSYIVSGYVRQSLNGVACGFGGVEIWVDDVFKGVKTNEEGYYEFLVEESGNYTIEPRLEGHSFVPSQQRLLVEEELTDINFEDTRTNFLEGDIKGGCDIFIGMAAIRAVSLGGEGCIDTMFLTNSVGHYKAILPAREYLVEVVDFYPTNDLDIDPDAVLSYFDTKEVDLTYEGQTEDFVYRRPPEIIVTGLPQDNCSQLGASVLAQNESYLLDIEVRESFGTANCPVAEGYVLVFDEAGDKANEPDTLFLENGRAIYELVPGLPNLISPHQKLLELVASVGKETAQWSEPLVVTGIRPREQTFTTVLPEMPLLILHDPPGDASYSYFNQGNTTELGIRIFGQAEGSLTVKKEVKLGSRFESGPDFYSLKYESWGTIGGALSLGARVSGDAEWIVSTTSTQAFSTSNNENITGGEGDVFVGAAMNLIYAQADILSYDPTSCSLDLDIDLVMGNDGFATTFMYTEDHIQKTLIPQLAGLRDFYLENNPDSAAIYNNQLAVWKQVLQNNQANKKAASFVENRSFSAGATYASSVTSTSESSASLEVSAFMEESVVLGAGYDIAGSGISGSVETKLRVEVGSSVSGASLSSTTTGFELKDDDPGDFFSVDIKKDPIYGTPVFGLVSGRSSCPWEPGTQPRESLQLQSDSYLQRNIPENEKAVFQLSLGNISQSDEPRTYVLQFLQASNPEGAIVTIGGSQAQTPIPFTIAAGAQRQATITVERGPRALNYDGLQFVLSSGCEDDAVADTVSLSVQFQSSFPDLAVARPFDNWLVNTSDDHELLVRFLGYDKSRLKKVELQYAPSGSFSWNTGAVWQPDDLSDATDGTVARWSVLNIQDGAYDLRLRADYGTGDVYSGVLKGQIDRRAPKVFGLPEPADGELTTSEVISITFDELLDCYAMTPSKVLFRSLTTGKTYPVEVGCSERTLIVRPLWNANAHRGENVEVALMEVSDLYQNMVTDTIRWQFSIGSEDGPPLLDSDNDGVPDADDNCPLAANSDQSDLDGDGIGDACDEDLDGDGVLNSMDNCVFYPNPGQEDLDANGVGDICEPSADGDGDGVVNEDDNCPFNPNPGQEDLDGDGLGDLCDPDRDGDGLLNSEDNCPDIPNPSQLDGNGDLTGDACENLTNTDEQELGLTHFALYPNPASQKIWLEWTQEERADFHLSLHDLNGRQLLQREWMQSPTGDHRVQLDIGALPQGMYVLRVSSGRGVLSRKLMILE